MGVSYRSGAIDDTPAIYEVFREALVDLGVRMGLSAFTGGSDPAAMEEIWQRRRPLFEHLARTAEHFWLAERDGRVIGYARATLRDGVRELTEFFVRPGEQSHGVGRELLTRAFPRAGARRRVILATTDPRALARYLKAGVYARFPIYEFVRPAEPVTVPTDLIAEAVTATPATLAALRAVDVAVLGHGRDADHAFLLSQRPCHLYRRDGQVVGYSYHGQRSGPIALLDERDFPAVLAHAEREAAARGDDFGAEVPLVNRAAVDYLLARGCRMEPFMVLCLSDAPFGHFERYIVTSPPFFL